MSKDKVWVEQRSHEAYAKNYAMVFPHDEALAGRNMKKDPLHEVLLAAGNIRIKTETMMTIIAQC